MMRWLFQCYEGIDLHSMSALDGIWSTQVLRLSAIHRHVLRMLGPRYENCYLVAIKSAKSAQMRDAGPKR
jgi:hypothetical protein